MAGSCIEEPAEHDHKSGMDAIKIQYSIPPLRLQPKEYDMPSQIVTLYRNIAKELADGERLLGDRVVICDQEIPLIAAHLTLAEQMLKSRS